MSLGAANVAALIVLGATWLVVAVSLMVDIVRRRPRGLSFRLIAAGLLVMFTGALFSQFAAARQWPLSQRLGVDEMTMALGVAGGACAVASIVARVRSRHHQP